MGCSHQSVPSLSNVAIRCSGSTKSRPPFLVTLSTKLMIAFLAAHSFQEGSGSSAARATWQATVANRIAERANKRRTVFTKVHLWNSEVKRSDHIVREQQRSQDHRANPHAK